ncbi:allergen Bos d 2-like [Capricornis sumatraensis]|uniref:allergen Bos d 2-like n=1 Tax=Capricornis sumatraensis TaxID=34865 RepID=UPI003604340D
MKVVFLTLLLGLVCGAPETATEIDPSKVTGEWHTIYADNKEKIVKGGPLRCYYHQIECINDCKYPSLTFYTKDDGRCQLFTEVLKRQEGDVYVIEFTGTNVLQLIYVSDNMVVTYFGNDDGEKITKITEGVGRGDSFTQEELQKCQELNSKRGLPNENIENVIKTGSKKKTKEESEQHRSSNVSQSYV